MDREQIAQQIVAQRQTTKQLGFLLMGLIVLLIGLASGGGYLMYSSFMESTDNGGTAVAGQPANPKIPDGTDVAVADTSGSDTTDDTDDSGFDNDSGFDDDSGFSDDSSGADSTDSSDNTDSSPEDSVSTADSQLNAGTDTDDSGFDNDSGFDDDSGFSDDSGFGNDSGPDDAGTADDSSATDVSVPTPAPTQRATSTPEQISFKIVSKPSQAKVFLGKQGKYLGKTPLNAKLPEGEQLLTFVKLDHKKVSQKVLVGVQKKTWVMLPSLEKKVVKTVKRAPVTVPVKTEIKGDTPPPGLTVPPGMVYVKGGYFLRGAGSGPEDARPKMKIKVSPYFISRTEITVAEYNRFLVANRLSKKRYRTDEGSKKDYKYRDPYGKLPKDYFTNPKYQDYPVVNVDWFDAYAFARWKGYRLPTEAEWEMASRGARSSVYPWGMKSNGKEANWQFKGNIYSTTSPVRTFLRDKSDWGAYDFAGNVREWVYDWYGKHYYSQSPKTNPKGPKSGQFKVIKGGSWNTEKTPLYHRGYSLRRGKFNDCGFRCAIYVK